ncbi:MAG: VanZ family protein [Clostridia bacterium]|nr:VanZ family protein [Clostridia bacterium]
MIQDKEIIVSKKYVFLASVFWLISLVLLFFIYRFSLESAPVSTARSENFTNFVNNGLDLSFTEKFIRKGAHIFEYAALSLSLFFSIFFTNRVSVSTSFNAEKMRFIKSENEFVIMITFWFSMLFALCDEYIQLYVDGRSGSVFDVLYDLIGVCFVLLFIRIVFSIYIFIMRKNS